jgi:dienelactone hydrolase
MAACCPPGAIGVASFQQGPTKGKMVTLSATTTSDDDGSSSSSSRPSLECYQIGPSKPKYIIVVFSDVFGIEAGNHKAYCDTLQGLMGDETAVWMPDLFRGKPLLTDWFGSDALTICFSFLPMVYKIIFQVKVSELEQDLSEVLEPNLKATGCELVGCSGFCWGGWVVGHALGLNNGRSMFAMGVGVHPAWKPETLVPGGGTYKALGERTLNKPILFLPAKQDIDFKPDGVIVKQLAQRRAMLPEELSISFEDMDHGFVARGNPKKPGVKEAQEKAVHLVSEFFKKHMKIQ